MFPISTCLRCTPPPGELPPTSSPDAPPVPVTPRHMGPSLRRATRLFTLRTCTTSPCDACVLLGAVGSRTPACQPRRCGTTAGTCGCYPAPPGSGYHRRCSARLRTAWPARRTRRSASTAGCPWTFQLSPRPLRLTSRPPSTCRTLCSVLRLPPVVPSVPATLAACADRARCLSILGRAAVCRNCSTSFPATPVLAASFDRELWREVGAAAGLEGRAWGNAGRRLMGTLGWAPNINGFRDPRWGRGQETPGEDVHLSGQYAEQFITGLQNGNLGGGFADCFGA